MKLPFNFPFFFLNLPILFCAYRSLTFCHEIDHLSATVLQLRQRDQV